MDAISRFPIGDDLWPMLALKLCLGISWDNWTSSKKARAYISNLT